MLPFLPYKKQQDVGTLGEVRIDANEPQAEGDMYDAAQAILAAIEQKSPYELAKALEQAFQCMESEPHVEGEHIFNDAFDAMDEA